METICLKCQILLSGKNKRNVTNLSAELAQREVKVKTCTKQKEKQEGHDGPVTLT